MEDILLIDKPVGITSFDVIRILRRKFLQDELSVRTGFLDGVQGASGAGEEDVSKQNTAREDVREATQKSAKRRVRMGHAGTLDPLASGLMIIGVGSGTKRLKDYIKLDKEYIAEILVGERRTTGDMDGLVTEEEDVVQLGEEEVRKTLAEMVGTLTLPVSAYSAIKKDGVPMYKRARKLEREGKEVEDVPVRDMEVQEVELLGIKNVTVNRNKNKRVVVTVRFFVGSGTYIRSLAEEFGKRMGYPATLKSLRRTRVGEFCIEDAEPLEV